jgi:hypothetical protein
LALALAGLLLVVVRLVQSRQVAEEEEG